MILAYLGPQGTFSHQAAKRWLGDKFHTLAAYPSVMATLAAVVKKETAAAVVPIENSIEGSVNITLDFLAGEHLQIEGETILDIVHCLAAADSEAPLRVIISHPQALAQCRGYLGKHYPNVRLEQAESTAHAAELAAAQGEGWGTISSAYAARLNGLTVVKQGIADTSFNQTRFLLVGREAALPTGNDKTSLLLALPQDKPGGLYSILQEFAGEGINLTRIESRPSKKELGDYIFFIDCEGHCQQQPLNRVLEVLQEKTALLKILGSYPKATREGERDDAGS